MPRLSDITNNAIKTLLGYKNNTRAVLAINAGSAATVKTTSAYEYLNNGVLKTKTALSAQSLVPAGYMFNWQGNAVSAFYVQPVLTTVYYTLSLNSSGTLCVSQGNYTGQMLTNDPTLGLGNSVAGATWRGDGSMPDVPAGNTAVGIIKVVLANAATFTPGTTALDATDVTATYTDISVMPDGKL